jgi:putative phosphoribosyl transferase
LLKEGRTPVKLQIDSVSLEGELVVPAGAKAVVLFAHGSGSSRFSPRNNFVAEVLRRKGLATLLFDLLTEEEDMIYDNRFNITLLAERLILATQWIIDNPETTDMQIGYFGASTGAAAALQASVEVNSGLIGAVVSRGGRPDLAQAYLTRVQAPTLLIVGARDPIVLELNREVLQRLKTEKELSVVANATHLFEEPGALEEVAKLATDWFTKYLSKRSR